MEVDKTVFWGRCLEIIETISRADFVSFDLELSGIPTKERSGKKMTLEERYLDVKGAADRYSILQIGLTSVEKNMENDSYNVRPYNFNLNPLLEERLDIERIWSIQSGAAEFLLSHGFQMDLPMTKGVPYLSRDEARKAKELAYARWDKSNIADVQLKPEEVQSLEFVNKVRIVIDNWKKSGKPNISFLNIVSTDPTGEQPTYPELGNFEKRLVHQIVRAEYPDLVSIPKPQSIQIVPYNEDREKSIRRSKKRGLRSQIERQTGFRWIIEALCGGELSIDAELFARDAHTGAVKCADMHDLKSRFARARLALQQRRPALVGHNLFTDIIYLYRTFIGSLPPTLEEFREAIHKHFPFIVDTKYMATHNCGDINPKSSLDQIHNKLRVQEKPLVETNGAHRKYHVAEPLHEAGYDSFMTALIMIRLSTKLEADGAYLADVSPPLSDDDAYDTAQEILSDEAPVNSATNLVTGAIASNGNLFGTSMPLAQAVAPLENTEEAQSKRADRKRSKKNKNKNKKASQTSEAANGNGTSKSMFSHNNIFEQLAAVDLDGEDAKDDGEAVRGEKETDKAQVATFERDGTTYYAYAAAPPEVENAPGAEKEMMWMPPFDSAFWRVYGNKLRVFGTEESVWRLAS